MSHYDDAVFAAKKAATRAVTAKQIDENHMAAAIDALNNAWDELTNALVRQRVERDRQISRLINELAEAKKQ